MIFMIRVFCLFSLRFLIAFLFNLCWSYSLYPVFSLVLILCTWYVLISKNISGLLNIFIFSKVCVLIVILRPATDFHMVSSYAWWCLVNLSGLTQKKGVAGVSFPCCCIPPLKFLPARELWLAALWCWYRPREWLGPAQLCTYQNNVTLPCCIVISFGFFPHLSKTSLTAVRQRFYCRANV